MGRPVILCIDDEPIVLGSLKRQLLAGLGAEFAVETAESGAEALEVLDEVSEDGGELPLVISDHIMPGMRGSELLVEIHRREPYTFKVLLTGQADAEAVGTVVNAGALYRYIAKPWEQADLVLTATEACRGYRRDRMLDEQNRELRHAQATLQQLVAGIAHEANTPIGAIQSSTTLMAGTLDKVEAMVAEGNLPALSKCAASLARSTGLIGEAAERLASLVASTQRFVSLDESERKVVDVGQRLDDALRLVSAATPDVAIERVDDTREPAPALCHPARLTEVFVNLLRNAVAASDAGGAVRARLTLQRDAIEVCVSDRGRGMSPELLREVFVPGFATRASGGRTGMRLGLSLCKRHVEASGGSIGLESELGVGTSATVVLPRHDAG